MVTCSDNPSIFSAVLPVGRISALSLSAIARAISQGIIITAAAGNDAKNETDVTYEKWSGVIGVTAIDINGNFQDYSSWGEGVVSAAVGGPLKARNYSNGQLEEVNGTSVSTPLVAGSLALARQKWPQATTNQLLQLLQHVLFLQCQ